MSRAPIPGAGVFIAVALLTLAALAAALTGETLGAHARADAARTAGALTVRVRTPDTEAAVETAAAALRALPGVRFAAPVTRQRAARLLEQAGGGPVDPDTLPPVRLIEAGRDPALATDGAIGQALLERGVRADLISPPPAPAGTAALAGPAGFAGAAVLLVALALLLRSASLAAPAPAAIGADLGAPRARVLAAYGRTGAEFGFTAGLLGTLATVAGAAGVLTGLPMPVSLADMVARISSMEAAIVLLAPLLAAGAAAVGARWGAADAYDRADRLG